MVESHVCREHLGYIGAGSHPYECVVCGLRFVAVDLEPQREGWVTEARRERLGRYRVLSGGWLGELVDVAGSQAGCVCGAGVLAEAVVRLVREVESLRERLERAEAGEAEAVVLAAEAEAELRSYLTVAEVRADALAAELERVAGQRDRARQALRGLVKAVEVEAGWLETSILTEPCRSACTQAGVRLRDRCERLAAPSELPEDDGADVVTREVPF